MPGKPISIAGLLRTLSNFAMRFLLLIAGVSALAASLLLDPPADLAPEAWRTAGLAAMMAIWWMTGALPLAVTALAPLIMGPVLDIGPLSPIAAAYVHPLLFLFLGGFLIGRAVEKWGLHLRIALWILDKAGDRPARLVGGVMLATAFLSLWISNTAATIVMLPIAASLAAARPEGDRVATALMLGVAYSATIGGMGSLIGTPPNALFAAYVSTTLGITVGFAQWAAVGLPVAVVLLGVTWLVLTRLTPGIDDMPLTTAGLARSGDWSPAERRVAFVATLTAAAWIARPFLERAMPLPAFADAWIAMLGGGILFLLPSGVRGRILDLDAIRGLRWDIVILFGGGLALAGMVDGSGLAGWIGGFVGQADALPIWLLIFTLAATIVYLGELASNTAMAAVFLPIAAAAALTVGAEPVGFLLPIALAASIGFMLPVATPPNALVMKSPAVTRRAMFRAGVLLDVIGLILVVGFSWLLSGFLM